MHASSHPASRPLSPAMRAAALKALPVAPAQRPEEDRRTNELLATVAHELRNPLESLGSAVEILSLAKGDVVLTAEAARVARRQIKQMSRLIAQLLDAGRMASGQLNLNLARVRLQDVVADAVETSAPALSRRQHTLRVNLPEEAIWINADAVRCIQIFCNLLANAAKYTPPGGHISVAARREQDVARVCVADNGVGIAPGALRGVFDPYHQEDRSLPLSDGGLGIGLSVVSRLVQLHGGTVHAESAGEDKGSTFVVELPLFADKHGSRRAGAH
ncbi:MAG TPA: HAMP domain-containing sensor histidine kinase [Ramlibacter sp.]|nr:HAMP domain-containing sensor histidine kinase [Ramlibacter sp.]